MSRVDRINSRGEMCCIRSDALATTVKCQLCIDDENNENKDSRLNH